MRLSKHKNIFSSYSTKRNLSEAFEFRGQKAQEAQAAVGLTVSFKLGRGL